MSQPAQKIVTYEDLYTIPENMTGEIINGELIATPRPSRKHTSAASRITMEIGPPYEYGRGGPGGWIIMVEPEIGLGPHILVPDLAGWKKERFPVEEETNYITVPPNWVCEVLSPQTFRTDKVKKMPLYAKHGVDYIWLIDPVAMTLDAFSLASGQWLLLSSFAENDQVRIEPFPEVEIYLGDLWLK